ncbi:enoyl-CoA hydratase/carnithine racemase [Streptacidiphilus sp. MAP12-20]
MTTETTDPTGTIRWEQDADGVVTLVLDDHSQSVNTMTPAFTASLAAAVARLTALKDAGELRGVIVTSAKKTFFAGGDLRMLSSVRPEDAQEFFEGSMGIKRNLRALETLGVPVVAAVNGAALGGGLEIALACHHRVALDNPASKIGLPEVTLGLLPGGGGVVRTVRLLGIADALLKVLLQGRQYRPAQALEVGLVHELAADRDEMLAKARAFIDANPTSQQPWDVKGYRIPGGTPSNPSFAANLPAFPANLAKQLQGAPYPAPRNILATAVESAQVDIDTALAIEGRYFTELATGQIAKNMIQAFFFDLQAVNSGANRPAGVPASNVTKVAVLGAGMMGAGIAYSCAKAGIQVVLKDVSQEAAERGGIGFPGWTGGVLQYINGYEGGLAGFTARARELAAAYGERFEPPALLVEKAERGESFTD